MGRDAFDDLSQPPDAGPHDYMQRAQDAKRVWEESYLWSRPEGQPRPSSLGEQDEQDEQGEEEPSKKPQGEDDQE